MYRRILNSSSKILAYYFVISFLILFVISAAHHKIIKDIRQSALTGDENNESAVVSEHMEPEKPGDEKLAINSLKASSSPAQELVPYKVIPVNPGDTVTGIFEQTGISAEESQSIILALSKVLNPRKVNTGAEITINYANDGKKINFNKIEKISVSTGSNVRYELFNIGSNKYLAKKVNIPLEKYYVRKEVAIGSSFISSVTAAGVPRNIVLSLVKVLSYDIDFQRDIKQGDRFEVLYDKFYTQEGKFSHNGSVQFAALKLKSGNIEIYRHVNGQGDEQFYNKDGKTIVKSLLRTPINAAKISSRFGMRTHPIHGYSKMHKGVDFAARIGTPILAAGHGIVEYKGIKGGYGNYIKVRHNNVYSTAYAHISKFAQGIKVGSKVKQGQVIAYVGNTGTSTGAHLHYEVHKHGVQINPQSVKSTSIGEKLVGNELKKLKKTIEKMNSLISRFNAEQTEIKVSSLNTW